MNSANTSIMPIVIVSGYITVLLSYFMVTDLVAQQFDVFRQDFVGLHKHRTALVKSTRTGQDSCARNHIRSDNLWKNIGPEGGIVWTIKTIPADPTIIFIGTADGGLYKSSDAGNSWQLTGAKEIVRVGEHEMITAIEVVNNMIYAGGSSGLYVSIDSGNSWQSLYRTVSGFLTSIVINPTNPKIIYVSYYRGGGVDFPGVIKSLDGGKSWFPINVGLASVDVTDLKMSAYASEVLYAATLRGVFRTEDGGNSGWRDISGNLADTPVYSLVLDERHGRIYAGTSSGLFRSADTGKSWINISGSNFKNRFIRPNALVVTDNIIWAGTNNGLYQSTNDGLTWQEKTNGLTNTSIESIEVISDDRINLGTNDGFYQSTDGGESWMKRNQGLQAFDVTTLNIDSRTNPARVFVGIRGAGLYVSDDTGKHWEDAGMDTGFTYISALTFRSDSSQVMYGGLIRQVNSSSSTLETGIYKSVNAGRTWHKAGLENNFINSITIDQLASRSIYVGTWNGIFKSTTDAMTWLQKDQGIMFKNISQVAIDFQDSNTLYTGTTGGNVNSGLGVYKSTDGGESWQYSSDGLPVFPDGRRDISDLCLNPLNPRTIYAALGNSGVFKSTDGGHFWFKLLQKQNEYFLSITLEPQDTNRVYVCGMKIYVSEDAGQNWQEMMEGLPEYYGVITSIKVDPTDPRRIYAAASGYGVLSYYRATTAIKAPPSPAQKSFALYQNFPNPFNPSTTIQFQTNLAGKVAIRVYDVHGQLVRTLLDDYKPAGIFSVQWNGRDDANQQVASGIYFYRITAGNFNEAKKMILLQ